MKWILPLFVLTMIVTVVPDYSVDDYMNQDCHQVDECE